MTGRYDREILRLAIPSIISNVTVPLLGLADVTIMGHIGDARYIGAIAVGSMIFNVVYWLFGFLRMGTSGLTAQAFGARDTAGQLSVLRQSLTVALGAGLAIILLQRPLRLMAFSLMGPTADVEALALGYYDICVWGAPVMLGIYALTGWFVGMQDTRVPMAIAIGQNVVNILASLCFVFLLGMQVEGVALGTVVAQWTGFLTAALLMRRTVRARKKAASPASASAVSQVPSPETRPQASSQSAGYARFFRINRDIFLRTLCLVAVNLYFTAAGARQGALVLAVNTLLMQLYLLFSYFLDGFAYAGEALAGRYWGASDGDSLRAVVRHLFRWGVVMTVLFTVLYAVGGDAFLRLLTSDEAVVSAAGSYYFWALLIPVSGMAAFIWDGIYVGLTRSRGMLWACLCASLVFFALWFALSPALGNHALWLALIVFLFVRGLVQTGLFAIEA